MQRSPACCLAGCKHYPGVGEGGEATHPNCLLPPQTPCAQFLKANVEYLRQNYRKALKVLGSTPKSPIVTDRGECLSAFYFNNIGCVHFQLGKYSLAAHYFRKATEENDAALNGFPPLDRGEPCVAIHVRTLVMVWLHSHQSILCEVTAIVSTPPQPRLSLVDPSRSSG